jgi:small subunit ribosomal protein S6
MREYELTVIYDLAVAEAGGPDAAVTLITASVETRGGKMLKVDHWGRRRMAYPINRAIDGDYVVTRVEMEPEQVEPLEAAFRIDERVYRHLVVRADELPAPPQPREPRRPPQTEAAEAPAPTEPADAVSPAEIAQAVAPAVAEAVTAEVPAPEPGPAEAAPEAPAEPASEATETPAAEAENASEPATNDEASEPAAAATD